MRTGEVPVAMTHLVVREAVIVGDEQRGLDRQVTETLHKLSPGL